MPEHSMGLMDL